MVKQQDVDQSGLGICRAGRNQSLGNPVCSQERGESDRTSERGLELWMESPEVGLAADGHVEPLY